MKKRNSSDKCIVPSCEEKPIGQVFENSNVWVCKRHGENCASYVVGICRELNAGRKPLAWELELVEKVK